MNTPSDCLPVILDTPNIVFHNQHRGIKQIENNFLAILNLLIHPLVIFVIITPKILKFFQRETLFVTQIINQNNGHIIYSEDQDPDIVVLDLALKLGAPIITNDKFRQPEYDNYTKIKHRVIRFDIVSTSIIPKNDYWKNYLGVGESD